MEKLTRVVAGWWCKDDKVLLTQRYPNKIAEWSETWALPGGKIEEGETPEEALRREWREELASDIEVGILLCAYTYRVSGYPYPVQISVYLVNSATEPMLTTAGGQAMGWFSISRALWGLMEKDHIGNIKCLPSTLRADESFYAYRG